MSTFLCQGALSVTRKHDKKGNIEAKQCRKFKNLPLLQRSEKLFGEICCHLKLLEAELMLYFPKIDSSSYVSNPFFVNSSVLLVGAKFRKMQVGTAEQEEIIDIQSDEAAKIRHKECCSINFWLTISSLSPSFSDSKSYSSVACIYLCNRNVNRTSLPQ